MAGSLHAQLGDPRASIVECAASLTSFTLTQINLTNGFVAKQLSVLSPLKRLPVLDVSGRGITSLPAMLRLIATGSSLYSGSPAELAAIDAQVTVAVCEFLVLADSVVQPIFGNAEDKPELRAYAQKQCLEYLAILNAHLKGKQFVCGEALSIADIAWAGALTNLLRLVLNAKLRQKFTEVTRWFTEISSKPEFTSAFGKVHLCRREPVIPKGIKIPKKFDPVMFTDPNKS